MCGLVGFITSESKYGEDYRAKFLRQALIMDTVRGDDSTGIYGVFHEQPKDLGPYWCKEVSAGYDFVHSDAYLDNFFDVAPYRAAVGHNRAATSGSTDVAGAHPFVVGPITLVHNGTLNRTYNLPVPMHEIDDCSVDSHAIAHNLAEHSVEDVVKELNGAFVLIWHDARDDSLNVIRNEQRPFHMTLGLNQKTIFFASEGPMLECLTKRQNIKTGPIYYPKAGQHLKWLSDTELTAPIVTELPMYYDDWGKSQVSGYGGYMSGEGGYWDNKAGKWVDDVYDWRDDYRGSGTDTGKYEPPRDDRVYLGGRKKAIPMPLQEELLKHDLVTEDRLLFIPKVDVTNGGGRTRVFGLLAGGLKALICSINDHTAKNMKGSWTVRPLGVYTKPSGEPLIIVKLVSNTFVHGPKQKGDLNEDLARDTNGDQKRWKGPYGSMYGLTAWLEATAGGCGFCGKVISAADHHDIVWISNGNVPLCPSCDDDEEIPQ